LVDIEKITNLYAEMRKESALSGGLLVCARHIESIMRMAEASAKMKFK